MPVDLPSTSTGRRRLPYAEQMTRAHCSHAADRKLGYDPGHGGIDVPDRGARIHPNAGSSEKIASHARSAGKSGHLKRAFGNPLPLTAKDGATGAGCADVSARGQPEDSAFLTPPSDLASSSSGVVTPSSSR